MPISNTSCGERRSHTLPELFWCSTDKTYVLCLNNGAVVRVRARASLLDMFRSSYFVS